ncbi:MAG: hypothetical protein HQL23_06415 [Candidatus Omnitrophica bacterium]|nr:hypothetical protein [Candidatus Omnitrophota bacterium]
MIKSVLAEELENSSRMQNEYLKLLKQLPAGSLAKKDRNGKAYYYIAQRIEGRVKFIYKGKASSEEIKHYAESKRLRAKYRNLLSKLKKQIKFLRGALRGKEPV